MKKIDACISHKTDDWKTPKAIYRFFTEKLNCIDAFPFKADYDEFKKEYYGLPIFINPPFSKMKQVAKWIWHHVVDMKCDVYLLIPARTDTQYFHDLLKLSPKIYFIKGRLHYSESKSAPFPTLLMVFTHPDGSYPSWEAIEQSKISRL